MALIRESGIFKSVFAKKVKTPIGPDLTSIANLSNFGNLHPAVKLTSISTPSLSRSPPGSVLEKFPNTRPCLLRTSSTFATDSKPKTSPCRLTAFHCSSIQTFYQVEKPRWPHLGANMDLGSFPELSGRVSYLAVAFA